MTDFRFCRFSIPWCRCDHTITRLPYKNVVLVNGISENIKKHTSEDLKKLDHKETEQYDNPKVAPDLSSPEGSGNGEVHRRRTRFNEGGDDRDILTAMEEDIEVHQYFVADQLSSSFSYLHQVDSLFESHPGPKGRTSGNQRDSRQRSKRSKNTKKDSTKNGKRRNDNEPRKGDDTMDGIDVAAKEVRLVQRRYGAKLL